MWRGGRLRGRRRLQGRLSNNQAFVVSETDGCWGDAVEVPGTAALNSGGDARLQLGLVCRAGRLRGGRLVQGRHRPLPGLRGQRLRRRRSPPPPPPPPPACVVPHLVGKTLPAAKKALGASHCGVGKIKKVYSKAKKGRVVTQSPKAGRHLKNGSKVALSVSKGRK